MKPFLPAAAALALALTAAAQAADVGAMPKMARAQGVVTAITPTALTLAEPGGKPETIALVPDWRVSVSKRIAVEDIQPGSYLGTTNHPGPGATGVSTEIHVSPPGQTGPGVDFVMDAAANTQMTNGTVSTVVRTDGGRALTINYGPGVRTVTVPPNIPIALNSPGARDQVKVGQTVRVVSFLSPTGEVTRQSVTVGENGAPPPS